jgi:kynurenine formamidase
MVLYDLSQPIENGMTYVPGDPEPNIVPWPLDSPWRVSALQLGTHCGTHLDAPAHVGAGATIDDLPLARLIGRGVVVDVTGKRAGERIGLDDVVAARTNLQQGAWAILHTGWSRHWRTAAYLQHPVVDPALARALVEWDVGLLAVDMLNPDDTATGASTIHDILLPAGVLIAENLTGLDQLAAGQLYTFALLPLKLAGLDGAPVRAVAWDGLLPWEQSNEGRRSAQPWYNPPTRFVPIDGRASVDGQDRHTP